MKKYNSPTPSPSAEEFQGKQMRLAKRGQDSTSHGKSTQQDEFQMRPIRLGSRNRSIGSSTTAPSTDINNNNGNNISSNINNSSNSSNTSPNRPTALSLSQDLSETPVHSPRSSSSSISRKMHNNFNIVSTDVNNDTSLNNSSHIQVKSLPIEKRRPSSVHSRGHSRGSSIVSPTSQMLIERSSFSGGHGPTYLCNDKIFAVCLVNFHHLRGPEVQYWKSNYFPEYVPSLFKNLPFQALPDGSHLFEETFSNFNLCYDFESGESLDDGNDYNVYSSQIKNMKTLKTLFGCSCVQQVKTSDLSQEEMDRNKDITRSIVQKAVVVICRKQPIFNKIKEKLSIITGCYFQQGDFNNFEILDLLFDNLNDIFTRPTMDNKGADTKETELPPPSIDYTYEKAMNEERLKNEKEEEFFVNLNLQKSILKFASKFLIIFKSIILEKKVVIYSNNNLELLTQFQNTLILLMPNLINHLDLAGCPLLDYSEINGPLRKPISLNTNNRHSMLRFFGLPLQIFNTKGSFWNPYLPLQQLSELSANETVSYMVGCSNLLFVNQLDHLKVDVLINLDLTEITYPATKGVRPEELALPMYDKKFINNLVMEVKHQKLQARLNEQKEETYVGSDDYIRYQFEDYLLSLLLTTRYNQYVEKFGAPPPGFNNTDNKSHGSHGHDDWSSTSDVETNNVQNGNLTLFNKKFIEQWVKTANFRIWNSVADEFVFNFLDPKHLAVGQTGYFGGEDEPYFNSIFNGFKKLTGGGASPDPPTTPTTQKFIPKEVDRIVAVENKLPERIVAVKMRSDERIVPVTLQGGDNIVPVKLGGGGDNDNKDTFGKKISSWAGWYKKK